MNLVATRARDGGLRFGEMESWAMSSHGMAQFLKERLVDTSDLYSVYVCDICGKFAAKKPDKETWICKGCNNYTQISKVNVPYAFKLLIQELMSFSIVPRIRTTQNEFTR